MDVIMGVEDMWREMERRQDVDVIRPASCLHWTMTLLRSRGGHQSGRYLGYVQP